jgi:hypothetical protein
MFCDFDYRQLDSHISRTVARPRGSCAKQTDTQTIPHPLVLPTRRLARPHSLLPLYTETVPAPYARPSDHHWLHPPSSHQGQGVALVDSTGFERRCQRRNVTETMFSERRPWYLMWFSDAGRYAADTPVSWSHLDKEKLDVPCRKDVGVIQL